MLNSLYGEFCCTVFDLMNNKVLLSSSKLPTNKSYYYKDNEILIISDDLREILTLMDFLEIQKNLNIHYIGYYLTGMPDNSLPNSLMRTIYKGINAVPSSHFILLENKDTEVQIFRYWYYWDGLKGTIKKPSESIKEALYNAVKVRIKDKNKTGILLSGGLDSGAIACILNEITGKKFNCYSNVFKNTLTIDEKNYINEVIDQINGKPNYIQSDDHWALKNVPNLSSEPQIEPHQGWFYELDRITAKYAQSKGTKDIFDGIGSDELFSPAFQNDFFLNITEKSKREMLNIKSDISRGLIPDNLERTIRPNINRIMPSFLDSNFINNHNMIENVQDRFKIFQNPDLNPLLKYRIFSLEFLNCFEDSIWFNNEIYRPLGLNRIHSFYDPELIELVFSIPLKHFINPSINKPLLRKSMKNTLPKN
ncbi:hypothetical protein G4V62_18145 [Bacillaceae bacterium SIJ1]|uniref:asparagine synthase-related protein n=1 Tax=Litoribacterium kuwaitense TaxID=1398745 RepID=UPI0013EA0D6B|nr:asparagine synthase-related protein [Litoribacterium kuwaitense]NGP46768.1 hypothetical protein [Litoribacterium kuwaitense]